MKSSFFRLSIWVILCLWGMPAVMAADKAAEPAVKKSDSGLCHDSKSPSYERTKKFTEFKTIDECLKSGGRLPK